MRIRWKKLYMGRLPLLSLLMFGAIAGVLIMNIGKGLLLENTGLLDEYALYHMKYMTVDGKALFVYVLGKRLGLVAVLAVLSTTYLGLILICGATGWYGALLGMFFAASMIRYGIKGVLFTLVGLFPQYLFYVPAFLMLLTWCEQVCRSINFKGSIYTPETDSRHLLEAGLRMFFIVALTIVGGFLESFVNPIFMTALKKIF